MIEAENKVEDCSVQVARTLDQVHSLRDIWQSFQCHPNSDIDYYLTVLQCRKEIIRPHVLTVIRNGAPEAILLGRVEKARLNINIGYKTLPGPRVERLTLLHGGPIGHVSGENCVELVRSVLKSLSDGEADMAWFNHLEVGSPLYCAALEVSGGGLRDWLSVAQQHFVIHIPNSYEDLYQRLSPNTRHNLRRYSERLLKQSGNDLVVRNFREKAHFDQLIADMQTIAAKSYHQGLGGGFIDNAETRQLISLALDRGWYRAYILYIRGTPCAFWNGVRYGNIFYTGTTAYDPAYHNLRLGTFVLQAMLKNLCKEGGISTVDFGLGDAQYKRDWADDGWKESSVYMYAPTVKGMCLGLLRICTILPDRLGRRVLIQTGLLGKAKRIWRDRLIRKAASVSAGHGGSSRS